MIPTNIPSDAPLFLLPTPPAGASADLVAKFDQMSALFIGDNGNGDDAMGEGWLEAKKAIADHPCRTGVDLAVKLLTIIHEISPSRQDGTLYVDPTDFPTTQTLNLLLSAINDALTIGGRKFGSDAEILAAWARFTDRQWKKMNGDDAGDDETGIILDMPAHTPGGVAAKLRMVMFTQTGESRTEAVALGATVPGFEAHIQGDDYPLELLWSAIKSLEAMEAGR